MDSPLSSNQQEWELYLDEENNYYYWYNSSTGEAKWDSGYERDDEEFSAQASPPPPSDRAPLSPHKYNKKVIDTRVINKLFRSCMTPSAEIKSSGGTRESKSSSKKEIYASKCSNFNCNEDDYDRYHLVADKYADEKHLSTKEDEELMAVASAKRDTEYELNYEANGYGSKGVSDNSIYIDGEEDDKESSASTKDRKKVEVWPTFSPSTYLGSGSASNEEELKCSGDTCDEWADTTNLAFSLKLSPDGVDTMQCKSGDYDASHSSPDTYSKNNFLSNSPETIIHNKGIDIAIPQLDMEKVTGKCTAEKLKRSPLVEDVESQDRSISSPIKKTKECFLTQVFANISKQKVRKQDRWERNIGTSNASVCNTFDPKVPINIGCTSLLDVLLYFGFLDYMVDYYLEFPTDVFLQYVAQASDQYSIIMQANAMERQECIQAVALHSLFRQCSMNYLIDSFDFSTVDNSDEVLAVLHSISIDDIIFKYPFISYNAHYISNPIPSTARGDDVCQTVDMQNGEVVAESFRRQARWLFSNLQKLNVNSFGQLMTYTTGVFQGRSLFGDIPEMTDEYVDLILSKMGGSFIRRVKSKLGNEGELQRSFIARDALLSTPIVLDAYFYECCVYALDEKGYSSYACYGPSVGSFLLYVETEWKFRFSDVLQYIELEDIQRIPCYSVHYQIS